MLDDVEFEAVGVGDHEMALAEGFVVEGAEDEEVCGLGFRVGGLRVFDLKGQEEAARIEGGLVVGVLSGVVGGHEGEAAFGVGRFEKNEPVGVEERLEAEAVDVEGLRGGETGGGEDGIEVR